MAMAKSREEINAYQKSWRLKKRKRDLEATLTWLRESKISDIRDKNHENAALIILMLIDKKCPMMPFALARWSGIDKEEIIRIKQRLKENGLLIEKKVLYKEKAGKRVYLQRALELILYAAAATGEIHSTKDKKGRLLWANPEVFKREMAKKETKLNLYKRK